MRIFLLFFSFVFSSFALADDSFGISGALNDSSPLGSLFAFGGVLRPALTILIFMSVLAFAFMTLRGNIHGAVVAIMQMFLIMFIRGQIPESEVESNDLTTAALPPPEPLLSPETIDFIFTFLGVIVGTAGFIGIIYLFIKYRQTKKTGKERQLNQLRRLNELSDSLDEILTDKQIQNLFPDFKKSLLHIRDEIMQKSELAITKSTLIDITDIDKQSVSIISQYKILSKK